MNHDLTNGPIIRTMLRFALPMILGDLLQQCYNIADTLIVGRVLGADALAAVGSAFSLMTFLTSILLGLAMGSGTVFSIRFGQKKNGAPRKTEVLRVRTNTLPGKGRFAACVRSGPVRRFRRTDRSHPESS